MYKNFVVSGMVFCLAILAGCATGQIEVVKDDFKNTTMVKMELQWITMMHGTSNAIYTREFSGGKGGPVVVNYTFSTTENSANLEPKCMIKIDDTVVEGKFGEITGEIQTEIRQNNFAGAPAANNTGFVDYSKPAATGTIESDSNKIFRTKLQLPEAAEKAFLGSKKAALRIYYGTEAVTFDMSESDIQKIKDFIRSTPDKVVTTALKPSASSQPKY